MNQEGPVQGTCAMTPPDGLTADLLAVERGAQLAGAGRAEVSAVGQVAGEGGATGGA